MNEQALQRLVTMANDVEQVMKKERIENARTRIELEAYRVEVTSKLNYLIGYIKAFEDRA